MQSNVDAMVMEDNNWREIDRELRSIAKRQRALDAEEAALLCVVARQQIWRQFGCATMLEYLEMIFGYGPKVGHERVRVAMAIEALPELRDALANGDVSYSALRELTRVVTPNTQREWLDAVRGKSVRQVEDLVRTHRKGDLPTDPGDPDLKPRRLQFEVTTATDALLRQARQSLANERGRFIEDDEFLAAMAAALLEGGANDNDQGRAKFQIRVTTCDSCTVTYFEGGGRKIAVNDADAARADCDAQRIREDERAAQDIAPKTRREVLHRDGGKCTVPGCRSARFIEVHHIVPRSQGGSHHASNLTCLCDGHHRPAFCRAEGQHRDERRRQRHGRQKWRRQDVGPTNDIDVDGPDSPRLEDRDCVAHIGSRRRGSENRPRSGRSCVFIVVASVIASRWSWSAALLGIGALGVTWAVRHGSATRPVAPEPPIELVVPALIHVLGLQAPPTATPPPTPPAGPMRLVPCSRFTKPFTVEARDGKPVLCAAGSCLQLDLESSTSSVATPPTPSVELPTSATVRSEAGHWSACIGDTCKPLGHHLANALDHVKAEDNPVATLDLTTVLVGDQIWNVATDRTVTLRRPDVLPNGPDREVTIIGDVLIVTWQGSCTDMMCMTSQLVDRYGHTLGWVQPGGRVVRLDDHYFMTISEFSVVEIRDLHSGAQVSYIDPKTSEADFIAAGRLDDGHYALVRAATTGFSIAVLDVEGGDARMDHEREMTVPDCD